jgi:hypothetical protein
MSQLTLAEQATAPSTPAANKGLLFVDAAGILITRDDAGRLYGQSSNAAVAAQSVGGFATDTYVTSSGLLIPSSVGALGLQTKARFMWRVSTSKTGRPEARPRRHRDLHRRHRSLAALVAIKIIDDCANPARAGWT